MRNLTLNLKKFLSLALIVVIAVTFMPTMAMEAFAAESSELSIALADESKTTYIQGEAINVQVTGTNSGAWVGLYKDGDTIGQEVSYRWFYVADYNGSVVDITKSAFKNSPDRGPLNPGVYHIVLFGDDGYTKIVKTIDVNIEADPNRVPDNPSEELSLKLEDESKTTYKLGEPIEVRATGTAPGAWVGMYKAGDAKDPENGGVTSRRWYYVADQNGVKVDISSAEYDSNSWGAMEEGEYEIVLFGDGGYTNILKTISITIKGIIDIDVSQFTLETDKTEYKYGEPVKVKATGTGIGEGAWVGLFYAGTTEYKGYLSYFYVKNYEGMFATLASSKDMLAQGDYSVILFADNGYSLPVLRKEITVTRDALTTKVIRQAGCTTLGLEYAEYVDGVKEYREVRPYGHKYGEIKHVEGTTTHQQVCENNGDHKKVENCTYGDPVLTKAAKKSGDGEKVYTCTVCGGTKTEVIAKIKAAPQLATKTYVYNGKDRMPSIKKVYDANGKVIPKTSYTLTYDKNCKAVGTHKVKVKFTGDYAGTYTLSYTINPKAVTLKKLTRGKKSIKVQWNKASAQVTGYRIAYSTNKNFKNAKYVKVKGIKKASTTIKKLKAKKTYYVKIRTYKTVNGKTYYSAWSKVKSVKTK